jgi:hypothetical protein
MFYGALADSISKLLAKLPLSSLAREKAEDRHGSGGGISEGFSEREERL